ncbi:MAG: Ig-like domain-containing protein, partial [Sedimenticola sp.]
TSSTVYTATFTPTADGAATIDVNGSTFTDASSNNNSAATQFNWTYDSTGPTMSITAAGVSDGDTSNDATLALTFTSNEATTNFAVGDISVNNGVLSSFAATSSTVYTATFTPTADGAATIDVNGSTFTDAASNDNSAATQFNWTYDSTAPTMTITASEGADGFTSNDATLSLTFTSSDATTNFAVGDISVVNGALSSFAGSGTTYTATFTPAADGAVTIDVNGSTFTDASANNNSAATQFNWTYDGTGPTMTITAAEVSDGDTSGDATLSLTFTSSESTSNFAVGDISVTNGALSSFAGSGATYTATFTPTADGAVTIDVADATFTDALSNDNSAATQFNWTYSSGPDEAETVATTQQAVQNFAGKRMVMITSQGPGLSGFLGGDGLGGGFNGFFGDSPVGLNFSGDSDYNQGSFSTSLQQFIHAEQRAYARKLASNGAAEGGGVPDELQSPIRSPANLWIKGRWTHAKEDRGNIDEKSDFGIVYIGTDWRHSKDLLIGLMGQIDWADEKSTGLNIEAEGKGWMLGPYVVSRLTDTLILDLRGAWGQSDNKVNPLGTYWDSYDSERWQIEGNLTGSFDHDRWHVAPSLGWNYFEEKQKAYTDNNGFRIGEQTASLGSLNFGPTASYTLRETDDGLLIRPLVGLKGVWDFDAPDITAVNGLAVGTEGLRAQLKVGINLRTVKGLTFQGSYIYDGIGVSDFESHTAELILSMPLRSSALPKGSSIRGSYSLQGINYLNSFEQNSEDAQSAKLSVDIPF